jgi:hypothetical protein
VAPVITQTCAVEGSLHVLYVFVTSGYPSARQHGSGRHVFPVHWLHRSQYGWLLPTISFGWGQARNAPGQGLDP